MRERASRTTLARKQIANFELELWERASCTTFVLKNCDFASELWECSSRTTFALLPCKLSAGAAEMHFAYYFST